MGKKNTVDWKFFWTDKWEKNEIGFHLEKPNEELVSFYHNMKLSPGDAIFLPLCGKSNDLIWLAKRGLNVFGCELCEIACESFFIENEISYQVEKRGDFRVYQSQNITLFQGDFFNLNEKMFPKLNGIYDRAAMIALPFDLRKLYCDHLKKIMNTDTILLLMTLSHTGPLDIGPPFSISRNELRDNLGDSSLSEVEMKQTSIGSPRYKNSGINKVYSHVYKIHHV